MPIGQELRKVEVFVKGEWTRIPFRNLKKGDRFRLYDMGGPVKDEQGQSEFIAMGEPGPSKENPDIFGIKAEGVASA